MDNVANEPGCEVCKKVCWLVQKIILLFVSILKSTNKSLYSCNSKRTAMQKYKATGYLTLFDEKERQ